MTSQRRGQPRPVTRRGLSCEVELLEKRALLAAATETFAGPSLAGLIFLAREGKNTSIAAINTMLQALESQLESGPLADLKAGTVTGAQFVTEVTSLNTSYQANVADQLSPEFPNIDRLLDLSGDKVVANVVSLSQQQIVGLITSAQLITDSTAAIDALTGGPLFPVHTPLSGYVERTQGFETELNTVVASLSTGATPKLTLAQVNTTLQAEASAYLAAIDSALLVTQPAIADMVDAAVNTLKTTSANIAQTAPTDAQAQLTTAVNAFDVAVLDTTGIFGPMGIVAQTIARNTDSDFGDDSD